jgi:hypothetical protein
MLAAGAVLERNVTIDAQPFYAIELPINIEQETGRNPVVVVSLFHDMDAVFSRTFTPREINVMNKMYVPIPPFSHLGDAFTLRIQSFGIRGQIVIYGRVTVPVIFDRELPDARIFLNAGALPRFYAVSHLRKMSDEQFLAAKDVDFSREAIVTDAAAGGAAPLVQGEVRLLRYAEDQQLMKVVGPTFLASSEKLTPELRVSIDGHDAKPVEINMLFAGVPIPPGTHDVIFSRRIGRGWWWLSGLAALACLALSIIDVVRR